MEIKRLVKAIAIWVVATVAFGVYYSFLTGHNIWKLSLIGTEWLLTITIAAAILYRDIKEIFNNEKTLKRIIIVYDEDNLTDFNDYTDSKIVNALIILLVIFLGLLSTGCIIYIGLTCYQNITYTSLTTKTIISLIIAVGAVIIFGGITLEYANEKLINNIQSIKHQASMKDALRSFENQ